jgi:hypothetical protein
MRALLPVLACSLLAGCSDPPAYPPPEPYEPPGSSAGGELTGPARDPADAEAGAGPTLEERVRAAELSAEYEGVGEAPSPYEAQTQLATGSEAYAASAEARDVHVNGTELGEPDLAAIEAVVGQRPDPGHYWYDEHSGLWGLWGHGAGGVTQAGLRVPTPEPPRTASGGGSGVLVNGRELTDAELQTLIALMGWPGENASRYAGSYRLDGEGKLYRTSGSYLGNLAHKAEAARARGEYQSDAVDCAWTRLGDTRGALGRDVTINCD